MRTYTRTLAVAMLNTYFVHHEILASQRLKFNNFKATRLGLFAKPTTLTCIGHFDCQILNFKIKGNNLSKSRLEKKPKSSDILVMHEKHVFSFLRLASFSCHFVRDQRLRMFASHVK